MVISRTFASPVNSHAVCVSDSPCSIIYATSSAVFSFLQISSYPLVRVVALLASVFQGGTSVFSTLVLVVECVSIKVKL